jgi:hypothetical protein
MQPAGHTSAFIHATRSCPGKWCNSGEAVVITGGFSRGCHIATAGNLTIGSSLKGAIVSRLMYLPR